MQIREYENAHRNAVIQLWRDCDLVVPWNNPEKDIARKLKVDPELFLVCEIENEIIGSVMGGYEGHRGWINYLAVAPRYRKQGIGRALMQAVEEKIRAKGCPKINLQVRESNTEVIEFYRAIGYKMDAVVSFGKRLETD